jgi:hypothetical protein
VPLTALVLPKYQPDYRNGQGTFSGVEETCNCFITDGDYPDGDENYFAPTDAEAVVKDILRSDGDTLAFQLSFHERDLNRTNNQYLQHLDDVTVGAVVPCKLYVVGIEDQCVILRDSPSTDLAEGEGRSYLFPLELVPFPYYPHVSTHHHGALKYNHQPSLNLFVSPNANQGEFWGVLAVERRFHGH